MRGILKIVTLWIVGLLTIFFVTKLVRTLTVGSGQLKSEHFVITYHGIYARNAKSIAGALEARYDDIRATLKDPEHSIINVYVHGSQAEFNEATGLVRSTANGTSRGPLEFHMIWTNWFNSIFPDDPRKTAVHEFTHCVQLNILIKEAIRTIGYESEESFNSAFEREFADKYPQWFWEALCLFEANEVNWLSVKYGMRGYPSLQQLNKSNQVYNVGFTIVEFMVHRWGLAKIPEFIRSYCDFEGVLGVSEEEFEQEWYHYVDENY